MKIHFFRTLGLLFIVLALFVVPLSAHASSSLSYENAPSFGSIEVGSSKTEILTIKNVGRRNIRLHSYWFSSSDSYKVTGGTCQFNEWILKRGRTCTINLTFTATYVGTVNDSLTIGFYIGRTYRWSQNKISFSATG